MLENFLINNDINTHVDLNYWLPQKIGSIFQVHFWLPNENISYERLYVRVGALPNTSPQFDRGAYFNATYKNKIIKISK